MIGKREGAYIVISRHCKVREGFGIAKLAKAKHQARQKKVSYRL